MIFLKKLGIPKINTFTDLHMVSTKNYSQFFFNQSVIDE